MNSKKGCGKFDDLPQPFVILRFLINLWNNVVV